jgi:hypothetical protein
MQIGDTITVSKEEAKALRKQGWMPRGDIVTMMYVGLPEERQQASKRPPRDPSTLSQNRKAVNSRNWRAKRVWSPAEHAFVARKLAEASA